MRYAPQASRRSGRPRAIWSYGKRPGIDGTGGERRRSLVPILHRFGAFNRERTMSKGTIAILTGGGDVPGLNPAIRSITVRALREGYRVIGLRRGWAGLLDLIPDHDADNSENFQ